MIENNWVSYVPSSLVYQSIKLIKEGGSGSGREGGVGRRGVTYVKLVSLKYRSMRGEKGIWGFFNCPVLLLG